jgi:signal transduction histidine kinase
MDEYSPNQETLGVMVDEAHHSYRAPDGGCVRRPWTENDPQAKIDSAFHRDEIVAMIVHELRNPLAVMSNVLQMCRAGKSSLVLTKTQEVLDRQLNKALQLVDDLLDISCLSRAGPVTDEAVDLSRVVAEAVEDLDHQFRVQCQVLTVHLPTEAVLVRGHAIRLGQVVVNLLDNSSKYSPVGGLITLRLARDSDYAVLRIQDNGLGITAEDLPHVFDLFFRSRHSLDRPRAGLGIGLALARRLVELHGGTIDARSDGHNRGSEFTLRLPTTSVPAGVDT